MMCSVKCFVYIYYYNFLQSRKNVLKTDSLIAELNQYHITIIYISNIHYCYKLCMQLHTCIFAYLSM